MNARTTALSALIACRKQGAWADGVLKEYITRDCLDKRDAALASRLSYGVLQNRMLLDYYISKCLTGSMQKLQPIVLDILRIGMYQILLMDKIPVSAAVNEAVEQTKRYANRKAAGLVNGVLRHAVREHDSFMPPEDLSVRYSHPAELVALLREETEIEDLEALLNSHNEAPRTVIQVNTLQVNRADAEYELAAEGVILEKHPWLDNAYYAMSVGNLEGLSLYRSGGIYVQDPAARLAVLSAGLAPGMSVLDGCAAPGGKSFSAAVDMNNDGHIISCDIHQHKIDLIRRGAQRLGISIIEPVLQDGRENVADLNDRMDVVIADVPCSGLGVIRKKPDIRYNKVADLSRLPEIQLQILCNLSRYVKPGGVLLYSTCTILRRENEEVVEKFLASSPQFHVEPFALPAQLGGVCDGMMTLYPSIHDTDGFFICKLRRD